MSSNSTLGIILWVRFNIPKNELLCGCEQGFAIYEYPSSNDAIQTGPVPILERYLGQGISYIDHYMHSSIFIFTGGGKCPVSDTSTVIFWDDELQDSYAKISLASDSLQSDVVLGIRLQDQKHDQSILFILSQKGIWIYDFIHMNQLKMVQTWAHDFSLKLESIYYRALLHEFSGLTTDLQQSNTKSACNHPNDQISLSLDQQELVRNVLSAIMTSSSRRIQK